MSQALTRFADYLPWRTATDGASQQHSSSPGRIDRERLAQSADTVAHEFFHGWNVERIRPKGPEPFDFDRANISGELCSPKGSPVLRPADAAARQIATVAESAQTFTSLIEAIAPSLGRQAFGRGDEPDGGVHRRRPDGRSHELVDDRDPHYPHGGAITRLI